jgi:predicted nucleotidyltransferase
MLQGGCCFLLSAFSISAFQHFSIYSRNETQRRIARANQAMRVGPFLFSAFQLFSISAFSLFAFALAAGAGLMTQFSMRLSPRYADFFRAEVAALRANAAVYLFGSRTDDTRRGGDVDILVLSAPQLTWEETARIRRRFWEQFGFQKVDLVCFSPEDRNTFKELVMLDAIRL